MTIADKGERFSKQKHHPQDGFLPKYKSSVYVCGVCVCVRVYMCVYVWCVCVLRVFEHYHNLFHTTKLTVTHLTSTPIQT